MVEKEESIRIESTSRSTRSVVAGSNNGGGSAASDSSPLPTTTKIAERLTLAVEVAVIDKNMSPGLVPLAQHYEKLKKHLRSLLSSAKTYQQHSIQIQKSRNEFIQNLAIMSQDSPIYGEVGTPLDGAAALNVQEVVAAKKQDSIQKLSVKEIVREWEGSQPQVSLQAIQQLAFAQGHVDAIEFQSHVLDYVTEWEKVVTTRIDYEWKQSKKLAADRGHYENKVEALRKKTNELESKGKVTPSATAEKLKRNEEKLKEAFELYERAAGQLCVLIAEATTGGWRDLYPLVQNVMNWEANRVGQEHEIYSKLVPTSEVLQMTYMQATDKSPSSASKKKSTKKKTPE